MASIGQGATQAPQPEQSSCATSGSARPPGKGRKRMAPSSQWSPQARQTMPRRSRQLAPITNSLCQGGVSAASAGRSSAPSSQASTQAKPTEANLAEPTPAEAAVMSYEQRRALARRWEVKQNVPGGPIAFWQRLEQEAVRQASQPVHSVAKAAAGTAQGGRISLPADLKPPRKTDRRETTASSIESRTLGRRALPARGRTSWQRRGQANTNAVVR